MAGTQTNYTGPTKIYRASQGPMPASAYTQSHGGVIYVDLTDAMKRLTVAFNVYGDEVKHRALYNAINKLGDKLLTDILGAKRSGVLALMVEPKGGARGRQLTLRVGRLRTPFTPNRPKSISRAADRKPTTGRCSARCALWPEKTIS